MTDNVPQPIILPDNHEPANTSSDSGPAHSGGSPVFYVALTAVIFLVLGLLIAFAVLSGGDDNGVSQDELRQAVREAVSTQVAALAPLQMGEDGSLNQDTLDDMINQAVGTQVAALQPTNTPIPPTPTPIPIDVTANDDAFLGPEDAPIVIVEFSDFQCGYCGRWANETLPQILENFPTEVKFVYRDFPIFGDESIQAAMATECAEEQDSGAFWQMHNRLFVRMDAETRDPLNGDTLTSYAGDIGLDTNAFRECLDSERYYDEVISDARTASAWGFGGTPGFIINGTVYPFGAQPFATFEQIILSELAKLNS
ncbi:MAG: thioredoxin domain-containing protein [Anaerolineae bacterium]|nr:thioredoxin domain-containing protein [Anaerolineae bacterium]